SGRPTKKARADERRAKNSPIQGSAQDIVAEAMRLINRDAELRDYGYRQRIQVHDELVGTCQSKYREQALARKVHLMENAVVFPEYEGVVRFPVEGSAGLTWGEAKSDGSFTCPRCHGRGRVNKVKCGTCFGEGDFNVKR